jgi:aminoglycoside phosphotransferase (APT) family kinase protein
MPPFERRAGCDETLSTLEPAVLAWMNRVLRPEEVISAERLAGGYTNENLAITTNSGCYVLRRYRRSAESAGRICAIEVALAQRLGGTAVPIAELIAADPTGTAVGEPLLLARYVHGETLTSAIAKASEAAGAQIGRAAGTTLAAIGTVTFSQGGCFAGPDLVPSRKGMPGHLDEFVESCLQCGHAATVMSPDELAGLRALAVRLTPAAATTASARQLVHADFNGKNLLAVDRDGRWSISAVLDWEFAFSGSPLVDIGNMLRFRASYPLGFGSGFIAGYREAGGELPSDWWEVSQALDLYALADFLTRPPGHHYFAKAVSLIRERISA